MTVTHALRDKTTKTVAVMLGLLLVPYLTPKLAHLRVVRAPWDRGAEEVVAGDVATAEPKAAEPTVGEAKLRAAQNEATVTNALPERPSGAALPPPPDPKASRNALPTVLVEDATGHALDAFYAQLARTRAKSPGAITRVMHYGDSVITSDYVSGTMRRKMQAAYGDAGHGFILTANPWEWYFHNDVIHGAGDGWTSSRVVGPLTRDGMYGLGGVTFTGGPGATAWFGTTGDRSAYGKRVSRFDVHYLETPSGGDIDARVAGQDTVRFSTRGDAKVSRVKSITVPDGDARLTLKVVSGSPRVFGVALERDVPGVVYDALGINGARADLWNGMNEAHWSEQMALRKPSLVVLQFGTNESEAPGIAPDYERNLRAVVEKVRAAAPGAAILIASPLDRAENTENGLRTKPVLKKLVQAQRNVAKDARVAFFSTFDAMGGEGSMAKWSKKGLANADLTHPSPAGAELVGGMLYKAITTGFEAYLARGSAVSAPASAP